MPQRFIKVFDMIVLPEGSFADEDGIRSPTAPYRLDYRIRRQDSAELYADCSQSLRPSRPSRLNRYRILPVLLLPDSASYTVWEMLSDPVGEALLPRRLEGEA